MSEDILEQAKDADLDLLAITDWGKTKDLFGELIAEVERLPEGRGNHDQVRQSQGLKDQPKNG